jgi:HK97 family phage major capsid protein
MKPEEQEQLVTDIREIAGGVEALRGDIARERARRIALERRIGMMAASGRSRTMGVDVPGLEDYAEQFSVSRLVHAHLLGDFDAAEAGFERDVLRETAKKHEGTARALDSTSDPKGSYLIATEIAGPIIELLFARVVAEQLGATVLRDLKANVAMPTQTGKSTAYWVDANESITESEVTFGRKLMTPKKVGAFTVMDRSLVRMANPSIEAMVRNDITKVLAVAVDTQVINGDGSEGKPLGLLNAGIDTTTVAIGTNGGNLTLNHMLQLEGVLDDADALEGENVGGRPGYLLHPKNKRRIKSERVAQYSGDTAGAYHVPPIISDKQMREMIGYDFQTTTHLPIDLVKGTSSDCSPAIFGNWTDLVLAYWRALEIAISTEAGNVFQKDQLAIRALIEVDSLVRRLASFTACMDARTNAI